MKSGRAFYKVNVPVECLYRRAFVLVEGLYWSSVCTGRAFVPVEGLYRRAFVPSRVCTSSVCTVEGLYRRGLVRRVFVLVPFRMELTIYVPSLKSIRHTDQKL